MSKIYSICLVICSHKKEKVNILSELEKVLENYRNRLVRNGID